MATVVPTFQPLAVIAERLHVTPRRLRVHLQSHPIGRRLGRQILFTEADFLCLVASLETVQDGLPWVRTSRAHRAGRVVRPATGAAALTSDGALSRARELARQKPLGKRSRKA